MRKAVLDGARAAYRSLPERGRDRLRPAVSRQLGPKVTLRRLGVVQTAPPGLRPALRPVVIEAPDDLYIPKALVKRGLAGYEPFALETYLALLDIAGPGVVLDIGANVGLYGLLACAHEPPDEPGAGGLLDRVRRGVGGRGSSKGRTVYSFEPTPRVAAAARRSAAVSGLPLRVEEAGVGESVGPVTLYLSDTSDASNSLNPTFRHAVDKVVVPGTTVDAFCARKRCRPAVVKIDTESTEPAVLRGARTTIQRHRPWIMAEVLPGRSEGEIDAAMEGLGYSYYHLTGPGPIEPAERVVGRRGGADMYLLAPRPMTDADWQVVAAWRAVLDGITIQHRTVRVSGRLLEPVLLPVKPLTTRATPAQPPQPTSPTGAAGPAGEAEPAAPLS